MADMPHEYTVKETGDGRGTALSCESFEWFVVHIREHGVWGSYRDLPPTLRLTIGPYYYWTMGAPVKETTIVNRALVVDHDKPLAETRAIARRRAMHFLASLGSGQGAT